MKQETLEEAAANYANKELNSEFTSKVGNFYGFNSSFIEGAEWQAKRMYNEEEVIKLLNFVNDRLPDLYSRFSPEEELKEFKKKM